MVDHTRTSTDPPALAMSVVVGLVLGLAAWTIGQTFLAARGDNVDAYNREKDIMLYVVSLFGTVTGYYLGRVPAEVNARRADTAARAAQQQLSESQEKLGAATAEATTARGAEAQASKRLGKTAAELRNVSEAIGKLHRVPRAPAAPAGAFAMRADDDVPDAGDAGLAEAKRRIDALLAQMAEDEGLA